MYAYHSMIMYDHLWIAMLQDFGNHQDAKIRRSKLRWLGTCWLCPSWNCWCRCVNRTLQFSDLLGHTAPDVQLRSKEPNPAMVERSKPFETYRLKCAISIRLSISSFHQVLVQFFSLGWRLEDWDSQCATAGHGSHLRICYDLLEFWCQMYVLDHGDHMYIVMGETDPRNPKQDLIVTTSDPM